MLTLVFLLLTLAITPLRKIFGHNSLVKARRMIGLFAFFYGALHLLTYVWFDRFLICSSVVSDVAQTAIHTVRHDGVSIDGAAGANINKQDGEAARREDLGAFAPPCVRRRCPGCVAFLDAGEVRRATAADFWFYPGFVACPPAGG